MNFVRQLKPPARFRFDVSVILCASFLLIVPLYYWGIPSGADMPQHYQFAQTFYTSLSNGTFYPSWSADTNFGYGDVGVRFYPPLTYYIFSFFRLIAGNWYEGSCLTFVFLFFVSGLGVYLWARENWGENSSLFAAIFYLIVPYHLNQLYQASMFAEFAAAAILPFCFLYAHRICRNGNFYDVWRLALAFGLLILTHIPTTVMASLALTVYVLFSLRKSAFVPTILKLSFAVLFSLVLSSFYWVKLATEMEWVKHNTELFRSGYYSYRTNFAFSWLVSPFGIELKTSNPYLNTMLLIMLGVLISQLIIYLFNCREKQIKPVGNLLAMTGFSLFMVLPFSLFVWDNFSLLQKIQFPWRWMIFVSLGISLLTAAAFESVIGYFKTPQRYLSILAAGLLFICIPYNALRVVNHFFLSPKDFFIGMVGRLKTSRSNECWWTTWMPATYSETSNKMISRLEFLPQKVVLNERSLEIKTWNPTERVFVLNEGEAGSASVGTMFYPHWRVTVNGENATISPDQYGYISFPAPAEKSEVRLYFQEPQHVITAFYVSGLAWLLILGLLIKTRRPNF